MIVRAASTSLGGASMASPSYRILLSVTALLIALAIGIAAAGASLTDAGRWLVPGGVALAITVTFVVQPKPALLAFLLIALFVDTLEIYFGPGIKQFDELTIAGLVLATIGRTRSGLLRDINPVRDGAVALVALTGIGSSVIEQVPLTIWLPAFALLMKGIAVFYVVRFLTFTRDDLRRFGVVIGSVVLVVLIIGFVELIDPAAFQSALGLREYIRVRGGMPTVKSLFFHPVLFGWITAFVALYAYAAYVVYRRWWWLAIGLLLSIGTVLSARRKPLVGTAVALATGFASWWRRDRSWRSVQPWAMVSAGLAIIIIAFLPLFTGLYTMTMERYIAPIIEPCTTPPCPAGGYFGEEGAPSDQARTALYMGSLRIGLDHAPLGAGLGRYGSWMSRVEYSPVYVEYGLDKVRGLRPRNPHLATDTFWPMILGELGALGLAAYLLLLGSLGWMAWRATAAFSDPLLRAFCLGTLLVFVEALIESLAAPSFVAPPVSYFTFAAVGVVASLVKPISASPATSDA